MYPNKQKNELKTAMHEAKDRRHFERYQAVFLYLDGYGVTEIGRIIGRRRQTIRDYVNAYQQSGLQGLALGHSPGKPKRLSDAQEAALVKVITSKLPSEVGFPARANWTLKLIVKYVEREWEHAYSIRGMSILLERLGLTYTRPTYTLKKTDPEKQRTFTDDTFPDLKKTRK